MSETKPKKKQEEAPVEPTASISPEDHAKAIIAEAEAKAAKIVADAEAKAEAAAEAKDEEAPAPAVDPMEELVPYTAPLLPNLKKRDILVGVNGETLRIKRGVPVMIKRKFFEALQNAAMQEYAALEERQKIQKQGEKALASM